MNRKKLAAWMYIIAGLLFVSSGLTGGKLIILALGAAVIMMGLRMLKNAKSEE